MSFCYLRVGRGKQSSATDADGLDTRWNAYVTAAAKAGLQVGGYWRFYPSVDLDRQVGLFTARIAAAGDTVPAELPPMCDFEDTDGLLRAALTDWVARALAAVQDRTAMVPLLYTYRSFLTDALDAGRLLPRWPLALARWTGDERWPDERAVFWQYAGDVTVPWAAGRVDLQRRRT